MTNTDELSRLARAITEAEDELALSNHRDDTQQLAQIDEQRTAIVERIEAREKALEDARAAMTAYAENLASVGAVKVTSDRLIVASGEGETFEWTAPNAPNASDPHWHVAEPAYSNGHDGHQED